MIPSSSIARSASLRVGLVAAAFAMGTACDYNGDFLFADVDNIPSIIHLDGPDGATYLPVVDVNDPESIRANTVYGEVGAPASAAAGGVTFYFQGTGGDVCVWVDPELVFWNQKVGSKPNANGRPFTYPDNIFDDGDLDLTVGLSAYYTGTPREAMGDFYVTYEDSLGNKIPIELVACSNSSAFGLPNAHAGRGMAEYCTVRNSLPDTSYTVALKTYSAPLDDDRLGFGIFVYNGSCNALKESLGITKLVQEECLIRGEGIVPQGEDHGPWFGYEASRAWAGSVEFEDAFCAEALPDYCEAEAKAVADEKLRCSWNDAGVDGGARCFCGDPNDTPEAGQG